MLLPWLLSLAALTATPQTILERRIERLARAARCEVAVSAVPLGSEREVEVAAAVPFKIASTFKVPLAIAILEQVDRGTLSLDQTLSLSPADLRPDSPLSEQLGPKGGKVSLRVLLSGMIQDSDNAAADRLLPLVGGPAGLSARLRELGLGELHVDRSELEMSEAYHGVEAPQPFSLPTYLAALEAEPKARREAAARRYERDGRDVGTARAMTSLLVRLSKRDPALLSPGSADWLLEVMAGTRTGAARLPAGLPKGARVAHKTGSAGMATNDVGVITLPGGQRIAVTVFVRGRVPMERRERLIADVARALTDPASRWLESVSGDVPAPPVNEGESVSGPVPGSP